MRIQARGSAVRITAPKQRTVLAMLLARAGHVVPVRSLVTEVWDDRPPRSAVANLRTYLTQLRKLLPPSADPAAERLVTSEAGYLLRVEPEEFDLFQFEQLSGHGGRALARRDLGAALDAYSRALSLWEGMAAEDVPLGPSLREVVARLTDRYLGVVEEHTEIQLLLGRYPEAVGRLREVVAQYPLRERLHGQLMVALYRSGDVVGALEAFAVARRVLAEELGIDPGPDLLRLHQAVLRRDAGLLAPPEPAPLPMAAPPEAGCPAGRCPGERAPVEAGPGERGPVACGRGERGPRQLPPAPKVFVGRTAELAALRAVLTAEPGPGGGPAVLALHGPGGTGKSALALRAAHAVAGRYPDGQLYVDLQGSSPGLPPLSPAEALGRFLRALGVPPGRVPAVPAEAAALYQSSLAGRRILVVLDNAVGAAQVAPLLPADTGCAALVTSRAALTTMDAVPVAVGLLSEADCVRMLAALTGEHRVAAEPGAAAEIARWCGRHPLAVRIAGARLAARPDWSLTRFGERLRDHRDRLDELRAPGLNLRSCFQVGYDTLTSAARATFRRFGVLEVPEMGVELAAALAGTGRKEAEAALDELAEARLLEPVAEGRYRVHDLLRLFAAELAEAHDRPKDRARALRRALDAYLGLCREMRDLLQPHLRGGGRPRSGGRDPGQVRRPGAPSAGHRPGGGRDPGPLLSGPAAAVRWLDTELRCLVAAAAQAARGEPDVARFVTELMPLVKAVAMKGGHWRELETLSRLAIGVARRDGDRPAEAATLVTLGLLEWRAGRAEEARDLMSRALDLWREVGDGEAEGLALHNLGWLGMQTGDLGSALDHITASLRLLEAHGSSRVGLVGHNLGEVLLRLGRHAEAARRFERCLAVRRADGDLYGESITLAALGRAYGLLDQRERALAALEEALARCGETGNREDEWEARLARSEILLRQGDPAAAEADLVRVLELTARIGDAYGQAAGARQLARARTALADPRAEADARRAGELFADRALRRDPALERLLTARL
ncbi:AfsR/SARP family transcriptional regulator [Nonomuraea rhodomycinica]|uniref:Tetratricopeptide repeat protein n=1 Tax=Nonomuraea rhodomycinica TaxID=1712872 RepID=A0A7Y6IS63_9ACTN|nr:BTAD domain-containing putative transcriptional regulator [Nonomuraea rhodomycinica]NUW43086.1 tetratricopeptide repeat protein [Nonomuraea rhodomycinica]